MSDLENKATVAFLLSAACHELFPERILIMEHSLADGYYCHFGEGDVASHRDVDSMTREVERTLQDDTEIELLECPRESLLKKYSREDRQDKLAILHMWEVDPVPCVKFGSFVDYRFEPMTRDKSSVGPFELRPYDAGFVLRFPGEADSGSVLPFTDAPKLYQIIKENETWGRILGVSNIGELNRLGATGGIKEMIWVAEGLHEKKISQIADRLCQEFPRKRVIFIAGPSASGKTTFSRRLGIQLKVNGFSTWPVSMDNYYLDHDRIPEGQAGPGDFESVSALDVHLLCDHADRLMDGKPIPERKFDFARGEGHETGNLIVVPQNTFIIFEGIHGLNPLFTRRIGQERLQRIYVSAITQLNVDNEHRVSTSDNRLLRRLVRDEKFRGYSCEETLSRWPSVRLGEDRNIFPYQEDADFMFNSSLAYEIPVLADQAVPLLEEIPENHGEYVTAKRLLTFLSFFAKIPVDPIPGTSILREFMGGSAFVE